MKYLTYLLVRAIALFMSILPFRLAYVLSDFFFLVLYHLVGYRKKVIQDNLRNSFPEKSKQELKTIELKFYHYLCDLMIEGLKGMSITRKQVLKRHRVTNPELMQAYYDRNISIIGIAGHYGNWEWGTFSGGTQIPHPLIAIYKPLSNKYLDRYMRKHRARFNCEMVSIRQTYSIFEANKNETKSYILVADQSPGNIKNSYWLKFLNQDTACIHGPEKYAGMYHYPVLYVDIQRVKRGYYTMSLELLAEDVNSLEPGQLTAMFMKKLEENIIRRPEYWLWSHRRWKHSKGEVVGR